MRSVWAAASKGLFALCAAALLGYAAAGSTGALAAWALGSSLWLVLQFYHLLRLSAWLSYPKHNSIPQAGGGMWGDMFDTLREQAKSRKKRKQQIAQALQRFHQAIEAMPNGVLILDPGGRIVQINRLAIAHLNLHRYGWSSLLNNTLPQTEWRQFALGEGGDELKIRLPKEPAGERHLQLSRVPFGQHRLLVSRDISEAEQLQAMRTAFVANVSHEMRTPLTVINGFLETMADLPDLPQQEQQQFIALMRKEGTRLQNLLADLLTLSRLESAKQPEYRPLNLSELAGQVAEDARSLSDGRHPLETDIAPGLWICGVRQDLYSALSNIAFNAVRYTPEGGRILIGLQPLPSSAFTLPDLRFFVRDEGPGIAAEHLPHLTERFYRVDTGRSRDSGGTGLGLAICKHALALHESRLEIDSTPGTGSEFSARFRQSPPPEDETEAV